MSREFRQSLKRHGGKSYLADKIIGLMPPRVRNPNAPAADDPGWCHYVEPYFGGGAVLLAQNPEGISEVVNDLNGDLTNFWDCLKSPERFELFKRIVEATPCSQTVFQDAGKGSYGIVERAVHFFIRNRQSRQALGKDFATLARNRTRRGMNELPAAWLSSIEGLPEVHARMIRVVVLNDPAVKVIRQQDGKRTLFYVDPTYLPETRTATECYEHEMTPEDHLELLLTLTGIQGRFLLSGYHSQMYDVHAARHGWRCVEFPIDNKSGGGKKKQPRIECVWMNY